MGSRMSSTMGFRILFLISLFLLAVGASVIEFEHRREFSFARRTANAEDRDRVLKLPGQPDDVTFDQYAGYVTIDEHKGRALFYWLTEAVENASSKPLVLWLNGGPGCSSVGYGALEELGPFHINKTSLYLNPYSWNQVANILFLESPVGVGFSYTNTSSDLRSPGDSSTAQDAYIFLNRWLRRFPRYRNREFYITGESYAGHYVPQLAKVVHDDNNTSINLKGYMVGNALLDHASDRLGRVDYWWSHALISDQTYRSILKSCNFSPSEDVQCKSFNSCFDGNPEQCLSMLQYAVQHELGDVDPYNIYAPVCLASSVSRRRTYYHDPLWKMTHFNGYDPCGDDYVQAYLNRPDVQQALHANVTGIPYAWTGCSDVINSNWQDSDGSMLPIYRQLIDAGLRIWIYSGDVDSVVPVTSSRYSIQKLNLTLSIPWYPWYRNKQVGGYTEIYEGLTLVTIRNAGHEVPMFQPARALTLFQSFLEGKPMPQE